MKNDFKNCDTLKEKLLQRRSDLLKHDFLETEFSSEVGQVKDIGEEANIMSAERLQRSLNEAEFDEIKLIDSAINRIENGTYGVCQDCSGNISRARLDFYPYAERCIVCQEAKELQD